MTALELHITNSRNCDPAAEIGVGYYAFVWLK